MKYMIRRLGWIPALHNGGKRGPRKSRHLLTVADIEYILGPLFRSNATVTDKQGEAMFVLFENMKNTPEAGAHIRSLIQMAEDGGRLQHELLDTDTELAPVNEALSNAVVGQIIFTSPGTGISYAPYDYAAICELIRKGHIKMYQNTAGASAGCWRIAASTTPRGTNCASMKSSIPSDARSPSFMR